MRTTWTPLARAASTVTAAAPPTANFAQFAPRARRAPTSATSASQSTITKGSSPSAISVCRSTSADDRTCGSSCSPVCVASGTEIRASVANARASGAYRARAAGHAATMRPDSAARGTRTTTAWTMSGCAGSPKIVENIDHLLGGSSGTGTTVPSGLRGEDKKDVQNSFSLAGRAYRGSVTEAPVRVLIVEDDPGIADSLGRGLTWRPTPAGW